MPDFRYLYHPCTSWGGFVVYTCERVPPSQEARYEVSAAHCVAVFIQEAEASAYCEWRNAGTEGLHPSSRASI